jgi:hypothetical protein
MARCSALDVGLLDSSLLGARRRAARLQRGLHDGALLGCDVGLLDGALLGARRRAALERQREFDLGPACARSNCIILYETR